MASSSNSVILQKRWHGLEMPNIPRGRVLFLTIQKARRNKQVYHNISLFKTTSGQRTFYYQTVSIWNSIDGYHGTLKSVSAFKFSMKRKML